MPLRRSLLTLPAEVGDLMDHTPESAYAHMRDTRPAWFSSSPGDGAIDIMRWPMAEGQVLHRDEARVGLEDPVVLPDGQHHRRLRIVPVRPEPSVAVLALLDGQVVLVDRFGTRPAPGSGRSSGAPEPRTRTTPRTRPDSCRTCSGRTPRT
ncbi:hypothetical protein ACFQ9Z_38655 [Streptomyces sp. NPDC056580]|uniref:hypothetical protein n=1 Tax=Streptomyces sp. NPDC056580 TaxID=3345872 RepID=UPI0036C05C8B